MLQVRGLAKSFASGALFDAVDLEVASGERVAIVGESGSGKSTLLNIVAGLDRPDRGEVLLEGARLDFGDDDALARWRRANVGFVFQAFHLLPYLSVAENVALPLALLGVAGAERASRALASLDAVGLGAWASRRPGTLSGGEMQRVAIARALANRPRLLLADEPTGELDQATGQHIADLLDRVNRDGTALVIVTHDPSLAARASRVVLLRDGSIEREETR